MVQLVKSRLTEGHWHGEVIGVTTQPDIVAVFENSEIDAVTVTSAGDDAWAINIPVPLAMMSDGVHSCIVSFANGDELARFSMIAGEAVADDLRVEVGLLRAELDLLKRAFRRHCTETMQ
ncbi:MAG: hypothetical protein ACPGRD_08610 [Planktomarina sp.]